MSSTPRIHVFTKPHCKYCARAKRILQAQGLAYVEHDIAQSPAMAAASRYYSGSNKVPQIFVGRQHINGADDLRDLQSAGMLGAIVDNAQGELSLDPALEQQWADGAEDSALADALDKVDLAKKLDDQENLVSAHFYKNLFGFTPVSYLYMSIWPEAYKSCVLSNVVPIFTQLSPQIGSNALTGITYAASSAQGCDYCTVHSAATRGVEQTTQIKQLEAARSTPNEPDNPFDALDVAMVELAEQATLNKVTDAQIKKVSVLAENAGKDPRAMIEGVALASGMMSPLNVFNDMVNVELEGDMAVLAEQELGLSSGRHATTDGNPNDLDFDLPLPEITLEEAVFARVERSSDWQGIAEKNLGYVPDWMSQWPQSMRPLFVGMYVDLMGEHHVSAELKQLMARVSAIAKGHEALAASAAVSAHHVAKDKDKALARIRNCYAAATDQRDVDVFTPAEKLALRFAWLSAQTPIVTPAQYLEPLVEHYSQRQLVELCVACGMASNAQRVVAALQIKLAKGDAAFCLQHEIETEILKLKYPSAESAIG